VMEAPQSSKPAEDVPVLEQQQAPASGEQDVPQAPETK